MSSIGLRAYQETERAAARQEGRRGFKIHAVVTALVLAVLVVVNITVASEFPWVIFPAVGMSIGLVAHWYGMTHSDELTRRHQEDIERRARS